MSIDGATQSETAFVAEARSLDALTTSIAEEVEAAEPKAKPPSRTPEERETIATGVRILMTAGLNREQIQKLVEVPITSFANYLSAFRGQSTSPEIHAKAMQWLKERTGKDTVESMVERAGGATPVHRTNYLLKDKGRPYPLKGTFFPPEREKELQLGVAYVVEVFDMDHPRDLARLLNCTRKRVDDALSQAKGDLPKESNEAEALNEEQRDKAIAFLQRQLRTKDISAAIEEWRKKNPAKEKKDVKKGRNPHERAVFVRAIELLQQRIVTDNQLHRRTSEKPPSKDACAEALGVRSSTYDTYHKQHKPASTDSSLDTEANALIIQKLGENPTKNTVMDKCREFLATMEDTEDDPAPDVDDEPSKPEENDPRLPNWKRSKAKAGDSLRVTEMRKRHELGLPLWHERDNPLVKLPQKKKTSSLTPPTAADSSDNPPPDGTG
jgi:hypothetical protein